MQAPRAPQRATPSSIVAVAAPLAVTISNLLPNTAAVRSAIAAQLADLIRREALPGGTLYLSHLREAISAAAGETNHVLVNPVADVVAATGAIVTPGVVSFV